MSKLTTFALLALAGNALAQNNVDRGLWVGEVTLNYVNEVSVPLDKDNIPRAPQPLVPTATSDDANLRLILHVNGAGQVSFLRDVALVRRKPDQLNSENDIALLTDERLYGEFPPQPARRIAAAAFDFGDAQATAALTTVMESAIEAAFASVSPRTQASLATTAARDTAEAAAVTAINAAPDLVPSADVAAAFSAFLTNHLKPGKVEDIAAASNPATEAAMVRTQAEALRDASFFGDTRGVEMVDAVVAAVTAAPAAQRLAVARATASSFADITNEYQRFIAGEQFGDLIESAGAAAGAASAPLSAFRITAISGTDATAPTVVESVGHGLGPGESIIIDGSPLGALNGTHEVTVVDADSFEIAVPFAATAGPDFGVWIPALPIANAVNLDPTGLDVEDAAAEAQVAAYTDRRAVDAITIVRNAIIDAAVAETFAAADSAAAIREIQVAAAATTAGRDALTDDVARYALPDGAPSGDYTDFVRSEDFEDSREKAAAAIAEAMVEEKADNVLATDASIKGKGRAAALKALQAEFSAAARSSQTFVRAVGEFGKGDPRLTAELDGEQLGSAGLEFTLTLPANHATNPFRHRRHPDHTRGFDIERRLRFDFDTADPSPSPRAGFGVDRITGVYREEIFGLHKPLGPNPETAPVGLRVEGRFELYRISHIDTLNAR